VPAYPGCPGKKIVKTDVVLLVCAGTNHKLQLHACTHAHDSICVYIFKLNNSVNKYGGSEEIWC